jgi:hypothetical protein
MERPLNEPATSASHNNGKRSTDRRHRSPRHSGPAIPLSDGCPQNRDFDLWALRGEDHDYAERTDQPVLRVA